MSSPFSPVSSLAGDINNLFILILVIGGVIILLIIGLVLFAAYRYRARPDQDEPRPVFGNLRYEIGWTIAPAVLVLILLGLSIRTGIASDPAPAPGQKPDLVVIGHQWWWEIRYPSSGVVTANEIHLPVGKRWLVQVESADVIHDLSVPQLGRKIDAIPGHPNQMWLQADQPGTYHGACNEYCGAEHAWMRVLVIAQPQDQFAAWEQQQLQPPVVPTTGEAAQGAKLFQQKTCVNCHVASNIGPNLTHLGSRQTIGAGVLTNTPENLAKWLKDPQAVKPGVHMPNFDLSDSEVKALAAYLEASK